MPGTRPGMTGGVSGHPGGGTRLTSPRRGEVAEQSEAGEGEWPLRMTQSPLSRPAADFSPPGRGVEAPDMTGTWSGHPRRFCDAPSPTSLHPRKPCGPDCRSPSPTASDSLCDIDAPSEEPRDVLRPDA